MQNIKKIYLYLVSAIALTIWVVGAIMLLNMALKAWVFPKADDAYFYKPTAADCTRPVAMSEPMDKSMPQLRSCTEQELADAERDARDRQAGDKQREAAQALSMILVAVPIWYFHWRAARREV